MLIYKMLLTNTKKWVGVSIQVTILTAVYLTGLFNSGFTQIICIACLIFNIKNKPS